MRIFLYEFITGGGLFHCDDDSAPESLLAEGRAMIQAVAADFLRIDGCRVVTTRDVRQTAFHPAGCELHQADSAEAEMAALRVLSSKADWTLVIAPEFDGHLLTRTLRIEESGGRLLGSSSQIVRLASDKRRMADHLARSGLPTPTSRIVEPGARLPNDFPYPAVLKPLDGAGAVETFLISGPEAPIPVSTKPRRLERYCEGEPTSVAVLCGPGGPIALPPCRQHIELSPADAGLSVDCRIQAMRYTGGSTPLPPPLAQRAEKLALRAIDTLENPLGYLGVDLVLGQDPGGSADVVIEINPRLTTSYVGLRQATPGNLAEAMLAVAQDRTTSSRPPAKWRRFDKEREIRW